MTLAFLAAVTAFLALNALFVAAEFAIVGAPRTRIEELASQGSTRAAQVNRILRDPRRQDRYIATAQLGITLASLGLGMYAEPKLAGIIMDALSGTGVPTWLASHSIAGVVSLVALTYLHIVLGEMMPKAIALTTPERAAMWITPIMLGIQTVAYPLIVSLNGLGNGVLRTLGIVRRADNGHSFRAEELQHIVRESGKSGYLEAEAAHVFDELIEFGQLTAREVMMPRVKLYGLEVGADLAELRRIVAEAPHARYPVYAHDLDHIVGMIHIKDIARRVREGAGIHQSDIRPLPFIPGSATLDKVLSAMRQARVQMAVIMDEHGGTDGIITTEDLFEEVVGDIPDVTSTEPPELYVADDGALHAAGTARIEELGDELGRVLEHEDVETVSGLVLALLDRPPRVGDRVEYEGLVLEVTAVAGHGVTGCRVTAGAGQPPSAAPPS